MYTLSLDPSLAAHKHFSSQPSAISSGVIRQPNRAKYYIALKHRHSLFSLPRISSKFVLDLVITMESEGSTAKCSLIDVHEVQEELVENMLYDSLVWSSLHGLIIGDRTSQRSGTVPGVDVVHAPYALLPTSFPELQWKLACEVAPLFNELIDRVSLDSEFLQSSLSRTRNADSFTSRLLDIHSKMLEMNNKEEIRLGLHRSDYMLDEQTNSLLQIELNTISSSFSGLGSQVVKLHQTLLKHYGDRLGLDYNRIPENSSVNQFADALAQAWSEYNNSRAVVMVVVQREERNMYDQHWLCMTLKERHNVSTIRKTLSEIDAEGQVKQDGTLLVGGKIVSVVYFRAGYTPTDYPSEAEWRARLLIEQSLAIKCPCISYHLAGTKKIQQMLAVPGILERYMQDEDVVKLRRFFAGLWSLDDVNMIRKAIDDPEKFVMKPQREGGGNNVYGKDVKEKLLSFQMENSQQDAAYILMQRIFPTVHQTFLVRNGICHKDSAISELGIFGAYLRNNDRVILNSPCGYLLRTKVASSNEGGVATGFAVLDSVYLT